MKKIDTRTMVTLSMLSAVAFLAAWLLKINVFNFLSLEPKDTVLAITGFLFGPMAALLCTVAVSVAEFLFISSTGWIGLVMNVLASFAYAVVAALFYKRDRTLRSAITGLVIGTLLMTGIMLLWNYWLTPLYMNMPREQVAGYMLPVFLPFNLVKGALNTALTLLLYKPLVRALKKANLLPASHSSRGQRREMPSVWVFIGGLVLLIACVLLIMKWRS